MFDHADLRRRPLDLGDCHSELGLKAIVLGDLVGDLRFGLGLACIGNDFEAFPDRRDLFMH